MTISGTAMSKIVRHVFIMVVWSAELIAAGAVWREPIPAFRSMVTWIILAAITQYGFKGSLWGSATDD